MVVDTEYKVLCLKHKDGNGVVVDVAIPISSDPTMSGGCGGVVADLLLTPEHKKKGWSIVPEVTYIINTSCMVWDDGDAEIHNGEWDMDCEREEIMNQVLDEFFDETNYSMTGDDDCLLIEWAKSKNYI